MKNDWKKVIIWNEADEGKEKESTKWMKLISYLKWTKKNKGKKTMNEDPIKKRKK